MLIKPKFYSKPFHIGPLDYIYARIARAKFHLKGQENLSYSSLANWLPAGNFEYTVDYQGGNLITHDIAALIKYK